MSSSGGVSIGGSGDDRPGGRCRRQGDSTYTCRRPSRSVGSSRRPGDGGAAVMRVLYDEHGAALWRYAMRLTGDHTGAEDVVQETLLRAWQHPEVVDDSERSARAWLFTVARNMIIDERRSARFRKEVSSAGRSGVPEHAGPDEVNAALDRMLIGDAMAVAASGAPRGDPPALLSGLVERPRLPEDLRHRRGHRKIEVALCRAGAAAHTAGRGVTR